MKEAIAIIILAGGITALAAYAIVRDRQAPQKNSCCCVCDTGPSIIYSGDHNTGYYELPSGERVYVVSGQVVPGQDSMPESGRYK